MDGSAGKKWALQTQGPDKQSDKWHTQTCSVLLIAWFRQSCLTGNSEGRFVLFVCEAEKQRRAEQRVFAGRLVCSLEEFNLMWQICLSPLGISALYYTFPAAQLWNDAPTSLQQCLQSSRWDRHVGQGSLKFCSIQDFHLLIWVVNVWTVEPCCWLDSASVTSCIQTVYFYTNDIYRTNKY